MDKIDAIYTPRWRSVKIPTKYGFLFAEIKTISNSTVLIFSGINSEETIAAFGGKTE